MFDDIKFTINDHTVTGLFALALIVSPFVTCFILGMLVGASL